MTKPADTAPAPEAPPVESPGAEAPAAEAPETPPAEEEGGEQQSYTPFSDRIKQMREELEEEDAADEGGEEPEPEGGEEPDELPPAAEGEEPEEEEGAGEGGDELEDVVFLALPPRRKGDPDFELPIDVEFLEAAGIDPADAVERINQLRNGAMYRAEHEEAMGVVQTQQDELDGIYEELAADPAGFMLEIVDPSIRNDLAETLVTSLEGKAFDELVRKIDSWRRNPDAREAAAARAEAKRLKGEKERKTTRATNQQTTQNVRAVGNAIKALIPDGMDEGRADRFVRAAATELRRHVADNKLTTLEPEEVPEILGRLGVLEDYRIAADGGEAEVAEAPPQESSSSNGKTAPKGPKASSRSKAKGADVRERLKRRKASASTPAGAGSAAPTGFQKVQGETYADRRNRLARAMGLPEKKLEGS